MKPKSQTTKEAAQAWMRKRMEKARQQADLDRGRREALHRRLAQEPASAPAPEPVNGNALRFYTVKEVAHMLRHSEHAIRDWFQDYSAIIKRGRKRTFLISQADLDRFLHDHRMP